MSRRTSRAGADRRLEPRLPANLEVKMRLLDHLVPPISGRLVDISTIGFRATHTETALSPGEIVEFDWESVVGRARVVWTRIMGDSVESGFLILPKAS